MVARLGSEGRLAVLRLAYSAAGLAMRHWSRWTHSTFRQLPPLCNPTQPVSALEYSLQYRPHILLLQYTCDCSPSLTPVHTPSPTCAREIRLTTSSDPAPVLTCLTPTTTATTAPAMKPIHLEPATEIRTLHAMHNRQLQSKSQPCGAT
jgi:hypothetical protein